MFQGARSVYILNLLLLITFLHVSEGRVAEAVGTQRVALPAGARCPQHQLELIQRTPELLIEFDGSVLGQTVRLITV